MSYEAATATHLLASNCCMCGRSLLDAASVEAGMGPHCRKKYAYTKIPEAIRVAANKLIHEAARECTNERRREIAQELKAMGADVISEKILDRFLKSRVRIEFREDMPFGKGKWLKYENAYLVRTAYSPAFNNEFKEAISWKRRTVVKNEKGKFEAWAIMEGELPNLWAVLKKHFPGESGTYVMNGGNVPFVVEGPSLEDAVAELPELTDEAAVKPAAALADDEPEHFPMEPHVSAPVEPAPEAPVHEPVVEAVVVKEAQLSFNDWRDCLSL